MACKLLTQCVVHKKKFYLNEGGVVMLSWAVTFLVVALIAGVLGLSGIAGTATQIAWVLFVVFVVLFLVSLITGRGSPGV